VRVDAQLQLGELSETVEVVAEAVQLQTENSKVSASVDNTMIDQLPLVVGGAMRSVLDLVSVVAEAKGEGGISSLGGGQQGAWGVTLDGTRVQSNRQASSSEILISPLRLSSDEICRGHGRIQRRNTGRPAAV
jgi:hypothetical protein